MARRKSTAQPVTPAPYVKSPLQLEQWAAYEALTAKHDTELRAKALTKKNLQDANSAISELHRAVDLWDHCEKLRAFVAHTMAKLPTDANQATVTAAMEWRNWALKQADEADPSIAKVASFQRAGSS